MESKGETFIERMEAGRSLLSPPNLSRAHHPRNPLPAATSVLASRPINSLPATSIVRQFPSSFCPQELQNDCKTYLPKEGSIVQTALDKQHVDGGLSLCEENENRMFDQYLKYFESRLLYQPSLWYPFTASSSEGNRYLPVSVDSVARESNAAAMSEAVFLEQNRTSSAQPGVALALAQRAMVASREAALLAEKSNILDTNGVIQVSLHKNETIVRSKRLLERRSKKRKVSKKLDHVVCDISSAVLPDITKKIEKGLNTDDPFRLFLWGPETKQLLTVKEEKVLFLRIQELMRLEEVKQQLEMQFGREPTLAEWAGAVGMSCQVLQSCLRSGHRSREKMIYANFRLVIHVARQYEQKGINIQDLLQEGSRGLMKSLEKFKPRAGCRFPTYAYWWIRQSIRKAIFQNSRTVRLPENVFGLLKKIKDARRLCIQEGHIPTNQDLAKRVGIRVEKLESLLKSCRIPLSIQERAWKPWIDQDVTIQEITADPQVETPDLMISKQLMRQHAHDLLGVLNRRERQIIKFRYGIDDNEGKSLSEIGAMYGLSKERVRQLETRAFDKLKKCLSSQGLEAYVNLLI